MDDRERYLPWQPAWRPATLSSLPDTFPLLFRILHYDKRVKHGIEGGKLPGLGWY